VLYVNLIEDRLQQKRRADFVLVLGSLGLGLLIVALVATIFVYRLTASNIQREIDKVKQETADLQPRFNQAKELEQKIGVLRPVRDMAEQVHGTQARWCRVLDDLGMALPEGVSLNEVSTVTDPATHAKKVRLRGLAENKELVSLYIEALNAKPSFDKLGTTLTDLGTQGAGDSIVTSFSLELLVAGTEVKKPEPKPAASGGKEAAK